MTKEHSFDIESNFDRQELVNAINQTKKELENRYDFRTSPFEINFDDKNKLIIITAEDDYKLKALIDTLVIRATKRGLSPKIFDLSFPVEQASGGFSRKPIKLISGITSENAKTINKLIRDSFKRAKTQVQGEIVRVFSSSIDELQAIQGLLRETKEIKIPLQFTNFR